MSDNRAPEVGVVALWWTQNVSRAATQSTGDTGSTAPTGDTGAPVTTPTTLDTGPIVFDTYDTGIAFCSDCVSASALANEVGGAPCDEGCATGGIDPSLAAGLLIWFVSRRRYNRSYST